MANVTLPAALLPFPGPVPGMDADFVIRNTWGNDNQLTATVNALLAALGGSAGAGATVSGTYTPTLTNQTNVAASTAYACQYMRVGNTVTVSGQVDIDPTAAGATLLLMTVPINSAFNAVEQAGGAAICGTVAGLAVAVAAISANTVGFFWVAVDTANRNFQFTFTYRVI